MKRLDNHLLTHYPLLWNLRLLYIWPAILLLHLLFWLAGYSSVSIPESLAYYSLEPQGGVISLATLCALVLLVLWLIFYFRNNPFKSFYPLRRGRLVAELGLIFITAAGLTTFTASYAGGVYSHVRSLTADVPLAAEANTVNLAHHFLPFNRQQFSKYEDCSYHPSRSLPPDSLINGRRDEDYVRSSPDNATDTFSFLHYCNDGYVFRRIPGVRTPAASDTIAKRWLNGGRRDSVEQVLAQFLKLCKKYGADYAFDTRQGAAEVFATPGFLVLAEVRSNAAQNGVEAGSGVPVRRDVYIEHDRVNYALASIESARDGWLTWSASLFFLYFSLGITLLIFSFRTTAVRVWFIALIGMGIWMAIFGVLGSFVRHNGQEALMTLFLMLSLLFLITAAWFIARRMRKRSSGVMLVWWLWSLPACIPILAGLVQMITRPRDYYDIRQRVVSHPLYDWIETHWLLINGANLFFSLLVICVLYIPLIRRWQAAPEE